MKKSLTAIQLKYRYFNCLKALAWTAIVCTAVLAIFILIESWMPGKQSSKQSDAVSNTLMSITGKPTDTDYSQVLSAFGIEVTGPKSYKLFMRKLIGHYLLFAVMGAGLGASCYFTSKHRYLYALYALALGVALAAVSEILQLPVFTTGRTFTWEDIGIDTLGVLTGIAFVSLVILAVTLILKYACKDKYPLIKQTFKVSTSHSFISRVGKVSVAHDDEYIRI